MPRTTRSVKGRKKVVEEVEPEEEEPEEEEEEEEESASKPDEGSLKILNDVIDYQVEMILVDRDNRHARFTTLDYFWNLHPCKKLEYGRLFCRRRLAEIIVTACGDHPYGETTTGGNVLPLVQWERKHWHTLKTFLLEIRTAMLRQDATGWDASDENGEINQQRAASTCFGKKLDILMDCIEINAAVAPIRFTLEEQIRKGKKGEFKVDKKNVTQVIKYMDKMKSEMCREAVQQIFKSTDDDDSSEDEQHQLESIKTVKGLFDERPFNLFYVQEKLEVVVRKWSIETFGNQDPALFKCRYDIPRGTQLSLIASTPPSGRASRVIMPPPSTPKQDTTTAELVALQEGRARLNQEHGDDPLDESLTLAEAARNMNKRRRADSDDDEEEEQAVKPKRRLAIEDQWDEDDEEDQREQAKLSELPRKSRAPNTPRKFDGPQPDEGIFDEDGRVRRRRRWTDEEKTAIKQGVMTHGVGHWVPIKEMYGEILRNRTSVQIKDCWRTMTKNNEV